MGLSKVEVNLRRLLEAAPRQQNQAKLVHYVTTARGLLEQLGAESTPEGLSSVSKAKPSGYSEMIEALAATLFAPPENEKLADEIRGESCQGDQIESTITLSSELRRRSTAHFEIEPNSHDRKQSYVGTPIKLDADAQTRVERQRYVLVYFHFSQRFFLISASCLMLSLCLYMHIAWLHMVDTDVAVMKS